MGACYLRTGHLWDRLLWLRRDPETEGVLTTGRRQGTVVAALPSHAPNPLSAAAAEFVATAGSLGASEGEALNAVRAHYLGE